MFQQIMATIPKLGSGDMIDYPSVLFHAKKSTTSAEVDASDLLQSLRHVKSPTVSPRKYLSQCETSFTRSDATSFLKTIKTGTKTSTTIVQDWTNFVPQDFINDFVKRVPPFEKLCDTVKEFKIILETEYGADPDASSLPGRAHKAAHLEDMLLRMNSTTCQDPRCPDMTKNIIEVRLLPDEATQADVKRVLRPERSFVVIDPLTFNCLFRELQRSHHTYPSNKTKLATGTKSITETFEVFGLGPAKGARAHNVYKLGLRGPPSTDPNKIHPDNFGGKKHSANEQDVDKMEVENETDTPKLGDVVKLVSGGERDGLYFRLYEYDATRSNTASTRTKHDTVRSKHVSIATPSEVKSTEVWTGRSSTQSSNNPLGVKKVTFKN
jgi:hypothetical protein